MGGEPELDVDLVQGFGPVDASGLGFDVQGFGPADASGLGFGDPQLAIWAGDCRRPSVTSCRVGDDVVEGDDGDAHAASFIRAPGLPAAVSVTVSMMPVSSTGCSGGGAALEGGDVGEMDSEKRGPSSVSSSVSGSPGLWLNLGCGGGRCLTRCNDDDRCVAASARCSFFLWGSVFRSARCCSSICIASCLRNGEGGCDDSDTFTWDKKKLNRLFLFSERNQYNFKLNNETTRMSESIMGMDLLPRSPLEDILARSARLTGP